MPIKAIIMGAAGRDFHNFNTYFKTNRNYKIVAFTASQIPNISNRRYPSKFAGKKYPKGIPIYPESDLEKLIKKHKVEEVFLSYSDLSYEAVMHKASRVLKSGAAFSLLDPEKTMLKSKRPVIAVTGVRTGAGKSPLSRKIVSILKFMGKKPVVIRHPMPYGDLKKQEVQRFEKLEDMKKHNCTIEEMEEYGPHIANNTVVYSGVDYKKILKQAEKEGNIIVWDGGNNDTPFIKPTLHITVADAKRSGDELSYYPGEINFRSADVILINKIENANVEDIERIETNAKLLNPNAIWAIPLPVPET